MNVFAYELHRKVPAYKWSVTLKDLGQFKRDVRRAIQEREIVPSVLDDFDAEDRLCGPNIYSVNEQFVKPRTHAAGGMSWALMLHPAGLKCDLFVSHAWEEGVFELIGGLKNAWPFTLKAAWCCVFANPQNLDISTLISDPSSSPFALALQVSSQVLVVSNSRKSIYTRLWCVYEAHLACQHDKIITISHPSVVMDTSNLILCVPLLILCYLCAVATGILIVWRLDPTWVDIIRNSLQGLLLLLAAFLLFITRNSGEWQLCNFIGTFLIGVVSPLGTDDTDPDLIMSLFEIHECPIPHGLRILSEAGNLFVALAFCVSEYDRVKFVCLDRMEHQLEKGYTGSVRDAQCLCPADGVRIFNAIGRQIEEVDETVDTLIACGMSTPNLRKAAKLHVDTHEITRFRLAIVFYFVAVRAYAAALFGYYCHTQTGWFMGMHVVFWMTLPVVYWRLRVDAKGFTVAVCTRVLLVETVLKVLFMYFMIGSATDVLRVAYRVLGWVSPILCVGFSWAGIDGIAGLPVIGYYLIAVLIPKPRHAKISRVLDSSDSDASPTSSRGATPS